jgi:hypothetical protein
MGTRWSSWWGLALGACSLRPHAPATAVRIELRGGPNPGTYEASSPEVGCSRDLLGPGSWTVQMSDWTGPKNGLRSLQLVIPSRSAAGDSAFYLGMVFGDFFSGTVHEIETRDRASTHRGAGEVRVRIGQNEGTVAITGQTSEGVAIAATIECGTLGHGGRGAAVKPGGSEDPTDDRPARSPRRR